MFVQVHCKGIIAPESFKTQKYYDMICNLAPELPNSKPGQLKTNRYIFFSNDGVLDGLAQSDLDEVSVDSRFHRCEDGQIVFYQACPEDPGLEVRGPSYDVECLPDERGTWSIGQVMAAGGSDAFYKLDDIKKKIRFDDPCNIQFTSGTTGKSKAAVLSHFNMVNNANHVVRRSCFEEE
ncbi:ACSF2, partial [Cordylochernes scorpioides]